MKCDYFDNVYVISLQHRYDRKHYIQSLMKKLNINFSFFDAINGHEIDYQGVLLKGEEGIRQSHLKLLKFAIHENLDHLLILEDDVVLNDDFKNFSKNVIIESSDAELFYFGATHKSPPIQIKPYIYKISNSVCLHAVFIKSTMFDKLIDIIESNSDKPVDDCYSLLQPFVNAYCCIPPIAWQKDDYSDIQNKFVKYDWLKPQ